MYRGLVFFIGFALLSAFAISPGGAASAAPMKAPAEMCAPLSGTGPLGEPPDIVMARQPKNAAGVPELILAVHSQHGLFCYQYTYDGVHESVAPTLRVHQGERFAIRIVNDITAQSAGERVSSAQIAPCKPMMMPMSAPVEHFAGYLNHTMNARFMRVKPVDTNLHLHGFQGPPSDEDIFLSTLSTPMHACEYDVTIPRTQPVGTYFYHPHSHGASEVQVIGGLAGAWIVEPAAPQIARADEHVITIRYRLPFVSDNPFAPSFGGEFFSAGLAHETQLTAEHLAPVAYDPFDPPAWPLTYPNRVGNDVAFDGCNGTNSNSFLSVDGHDTPATLRVPAGSPQLLRIVNATSDENLKLDMHDASGRLQPLHVVGLDGTPVTGDNAHPLSGYLSLESLMLPPAGRVNVLISVPSGGQVTLSREHYCEGVFYELHHDILRIAAGGSSAQGDPPLVSRPAVVAQTPAARLLAYVRAHPHLVYRRAIAYTEYPIPKQGAIRAHSGYFITDITNRNFHEHPFWPDYKPGGTFPSNPDIVVKHGTIEEWYLINTDNEVHTFHIHQMSFVLERGEGGMPMTRDTVFLPLGTMEPNPRDPQYPLMKPSITKIILDFRHVPRGTFVFHCHMLFHEDRGMMGTIHVE